MSNLYLAFAVVSLILLLWGVNRLLNMLHDGLKQVNDELDHIKAGIESIGKDIDNLKK